MSRESVVMLAHTYDPEKHDIIGWLMSEKWDGMRALWTGTELVSRYGNHIYAPNKLIERLPKGVALDGELWMMDRQILMSIVRKHYPTDEWDLVRFRVFDMPCSGKTFIENQEVLNDYWDDIVEQTTVTNISNIDKVMGDVDEGVMFRKPDSYWEVKRSYDLLKHKKIETGLAMVVGTVPGKGNFSGMIGSLKVIDGDKNVFSISGLTRKERQRTDWLGAVVNYTFRGRSLRGIPQEARYKRNV